MKFVPNLKGCMERSLALSIGTLLFSFSSLQAQVTFSNPSYISIPEGDDPPVIGQPYPATLEVAGLKGIISGMTVTLNNFQHNNPDAVDLLLVAPDGRNATILSDVGGAADILGITIHLNDDAAAFLPDHTTFGSGNYKPTNMGSGADRWPGGPLPSGNVALSTFYGADPNGQWLLYAVSDVDGSTGAIAGGWSLSFTTINPPQSVKFQDFSATYQKANRLVKLTWSTAYEYNSHYFVVERFQDNSGWVPIGRTGAAGYKTSESFYHFADEGVIRGNYLYRLKLVEKDSSVKYSNVASANVQEDKSFRLFPNPATSFTYVHTNNEQTERAMVQVTDMNRSPVLQQQVTISEKAPARLELSKLHPGNYFVIITTSNGQSVQQLSIKP